MRSYIVYLSLLILSFFIPPQTLKSLALRNNIDAIHPNLLTETVAQPHLEKFFAFSTFSMLPRKPHIAKDMKHSSRLENDKNASHFPSREVVQQSQFNKSA